MSIFDYLPVREPSFRVHVSISADHHVALSDQLLGGKVNLIEDPGLFRLPQDIVHVRWTSVAQA